MSNTYYNVTTTFMPGDLVDASLIDTEYSNIQNGFSCLPATSAGVGFASTVVVSNATSSTHAMNWGQLATWGLNVNANAFKLTGLPNATSTGVGQAAVYDQVLTWGANVNAAGYTINNLPSPTAPAQPATRQYADTLFYGGSGANPYSILVTSLNPGTAVHDQALVISSNGTSVVGLDIGPVIMHAFEHFI